MHLEAIKGARLTLLATLSPKVRAAACALQGWRPVTVREHSCQSIYWFTAGQARATVNVGGDDRVTRGRTLDERRLL